MSNRCIEIHDSVLARISDSGSYELHLSAMYIHQSAGRAGLDSGIGWYQEAVLRIFNAQIPDRLPEFPVELSGGLTVLGELISENEIPFPLNYRVSFELRLIPHSHPNQNLSFIGSGAELTLTSEPSEIEKLRS